MTGFNQETVRFGALDLVRGMEKVYNILDFKDTNDDKTDLDVLAVNVQENGEMSSKLYNTSGST
jgi:hypothetical protein